MQRGCAPRGVSHRVTRPSRPATHDTGAEAAWLAANQNLAHDVKTYKDKLEESRASAKALEAQVVQPPAQGSAGTLPWGPPSKLWDRSPAEWKKMADEGTFGMAYPCGTGTQLPGPLSAEGLALSPDDARVVQAAWDRSVARVDRAVIDACATIVGADLASRLGIQVCDTIVATSGSPGADQKAVALIRAGELPMPGPNDPGIDGYERVLLVKTGEMQAFQADVEQSLGPDDARRIAHDDAPRIVHALSS